jgi:beta-alanine degradation protein BauB
MPRPFLLLAGFSLCVAGAAAQTQDLDAVKVDSAHHKVVFENDQVRVVRFVVGPGDTTPQHSHPASVLVLFTDANVQSTSPDGKTSNVQLKAGMAAWRPALTHVFKNTGQTAIEGVLVEPKNPASARPAGAAGAGKADSEHKGGGNQP